MRIQKCSRGLRTPSTNARTSERSLASAMLNHQCRQIKRSLSNWPWQMRVLSRDYESPLEPLRALNSTESDQRTLKWVSAGGAGGIHFPIIDGTPSGQILTYNHSWTDSEVRQRNKLVVIQRQTLEKTRGGINQALQGYTNYSILEHMVPEGSTNSDDPRIRWVLLSTSGTLLANRFLSNYEINSKLMTSALRAKKDLMCCRPSEPPRKHWLYENDSSKFDIISNKWKP